MNLSKEQCYKAIKAQDARFDGIFFTAVKSTGIYCRPICKVPAPKKENCTFYDTQVEAESNGYRPCLRCRPEMAPEYSEFAQADNLIKQLLIYFEEDNYRTGAIQRASEEFGISERHIHRLFKDTFGVGPKDYIMTKRLLHAKGLLMDTSLSVTEISGMVGFGSVSRFNAAIKKHYQLTPTQIRKNKRGKEKDFIVVKLSYRPPYDWQKMMAFFEMRAVPGVENVKDGIYRRSLFITESGVNYSGWIQVQALEKESKVLLTVSKGLEKVILSVIKSVKRVFDLDACPDQMTLYTEGIRLPGSFDAFEMATRAILGQQITVKAARTLAERMVFNLGAEVETPFEEITHHFPSPEDISKLDLRIEEVLGELGVIKTRSRVIYRIAKGMTEGTLVLNPSQASDEVKNLLMAMKGIGPWTAEYLVMRGLSWSDAFPVTDIGVKHALLPLLCDEEGVPLEVLQKDLSKYKFEKIYQKQALKYAEAYRPWRSYLTIALWDSLS